jgi:epoxyqueuosine reductase
MNNKEFRKVFDDALKTVIGSLWGVCRLDFSDYQKEYNYGIVVLFPYAEMITPDTYSENRISELLQKSREVRKVVESLVKAGCDAAGIPCLITPIPENHQQPPYIVPFSTKYAAVRAGMGWIGKNGLLITREYGPRLTTAGFVIKLGPKDIITLGIPETANHCGNCTQCVQICPWKNIKGNSWHQGVSRDDLVDYHQCSVKRFLFVPKLGRKLACAKCIGYCPYGTPNAPIGL